MADDALRPVELPRESDLRSFARAVAQLLVERPGRSQGSRVVRRRAGVGLQHLDHRDYQPGDELRHVDWRQSARRGRPILRQFEAEASTHWTLILDASASMFTQDGGKWRCAVQATAALSYALLALGARVRVLVVAERVLGECRGGGGATQYATIVRMLRTIAPATQGTRCELSAATARLGVGASLCLLSDLLGPQEMRPALRALRERCAGMHVLQLEDALDLELPSAPALELVDIETGQRRAVQADAALLAAARERKAAADLRLRRFCAQAGIAYSRFDRSLPWRSALVAHLIAARP